MSKTPVGKLEA